MKRKWIVLAFLALSGQALATDETPSAAPRLYTPVCSTCHAPDKAEALGAPAAFDQKAWAPRLENAAKNSGPGTDFKDPIDYLLYSVKRGRGLMAHGGLCKYNEAMQSQCTDENYLAAIRYMSGIK